MQTRKITSPLSLIFILSTLAAMGIHYYLIGQHIDLKYGLGETSSMCNVSAFFNCDNSIISPYSEIFGIPLAIFGFFTSLIILFYGVKALLFTQSENRSASASVALTFSGVSAVASVIMALISLFVLKSLCPFCTVAYVLSFITLGSALTLLKPLRPEIKGRALKSLAVAAVVILVGSVAVGKMKTQPFNNSEIQEIISLSIQKWKNETPTPVDLVEPLKYGPDMAKMKIVEFADFLCPHCRVAYNKLHTLAKTQGDIQVIFQPFPLDGCAGSAENPGLRCQLAMTAHCSEQVAKKGWESHEYLFRHQQEIAENGSITSAIEKLSQAIGADKAQLEACVNDAKTLDIVKRQLEVGKKLGIQGTPTVYINDKKFQGPLHLPLLIDLYKNI